MPRHQWQWSGLALAEADVMIRSQSSPTASYLHYFQQVLTPTSIEIQRPSVYIQECMLLLVHWNLNVPNSDTLCICRYILFSSMRYYLGFL